MHAQVTPYVDWSLRDVGWLHFVIIAIFTGGIGYLINWTGLIMLFSPIRFGAVLSGTG